MLHQYFLILPLPTANPCLATRCRVMPCCCTFFHLANCPPAHLPTGPPGDGATWRRGHLAAWPPGHLTILPPGQLTIWTPGHLATWPPGHLATWPPDHLSTWSLCLCHSWLFRITYFVKMPITCLFLNIHFGKIGLDQIFNQSVRILQSRGMSDVVCVWEPGGQTGGEWRLPHTGI